MSRPHDGVSELVIFLGEGGAMRLYCVVDYSGRDTGSAVVICPAPLLLPALGEWRGAEGTMWTVMISLTTVGLRRILLIPHNFKPHLADK